MTALMFLLNHPIPVYVILGLIAAALLAYGFWPDRDGGDQ